MFVRIVAKGGNPNYMRNHAVHHWLIEDIEETSDEREAGKGSDQWVNSCTVRQLEIYRFRKMLGNHLGNGGISWLT